MAPKADFGLSAEQATSLGEILAWWQQFGNVGQPPQQFRRKDPRQPIPFLIGKATDTVSSTVGKVDVQQYNVTSTGLPATSGTTDQQHIAWDWLGTGASSGDEVYLWRHMQSNLPFFLKSGGRATVIRCLVNQSVVSTTDDDFDVDTVTVISPEGAIAPSSVTNVRNAWHVPSSEDNHCVAFKSTDGWDGMPESDLVKGPVVVEVDYTAGTTHAFQAKTREITAFAIGSCSTFETWHDMVSDNVLIDQQISGTNFQQKATQVFLTEAGVDGSFATWTSGTTCT